MDTVNTNAIVVSSKRDVRSKEAVNLDEDILLYEKNRQRKHDQLEENLLGS